MPSTVGSSTGWGMGLSTTGNGAGAGGDTYGQGMHPSLNRFMLPSQEFVTCVLWNGLYHITGTDIVRALVFRFEAFGRPVQNMKKFEEGVFSDLRNLKPGVDACLEEPKSPFLDLLFKYQCIRTQKKQKVFYWFSVPHDRLFLDALERDLKREKMGQPPTTHVVGEPALSFTYDPKRSLYEQFAKAQGMKDGESELETSLRRAEQDPDASESDTESLVGATGMDNLHIDNEDSEMSDADEVHGTSSVLTDEEREKRKRLRQEQRQKRHLSKINGGTASFFSSILGIFEGSPTYKQRRKKNPNVAGTVGGAGSALSRSVSSSSSASSAYRRGSEDFDERGRPRSMGSYGSGLAERHHHPSASVSRERSYPYPPPYAHIHRQHSQGSLSHSHSHSFSHTQPGPFQYGSMTEEFGPGSLDARERAEMDAATLFQQQARGELMPADGVVRKQRVPHVLPDVGVMISEGFTAHPVQAPGATAAGGGPSATPGSGQPQQQQGSQAGAFATDDSAFVGPNGFDAFPPGTAPGPSAAGATDPNGAQYETVSADGKVRAFMCPLYSCGRLFRRMEHLKRHLRTHTMERPYTCPVCQKRFSRSDNLNQHLRTHERGAAGATGANAQGGFNNAAGVGVQGGLEGMGGIDVGLGGMGGAMNTFSGLTNLNASMGMWRDSSEDPDLSGTESEGFDEDGAGFMFNPNTQHMMGAGAAAGDPMFGGMGMLNAGAGGAGGMVGLSDMQMCEIEVQPGDVEGIPGGTEEEGMLLRGHPHGQNVAQYATVSADFGQQWTQPSPAFSNISPPGSAPPPPQQQQQQPQQQRPGTGNRASIGGPPTGFMHRPNSSISSMAGYPVNGVNGTAEEYVTSMSMSAPSHKQAFDHTGIYPPGLLDSAANPTPPSSSSTNPSAAAAVANPSTSVPNPVGTPALVNAALAGPIRRHRSMTPSLIGRTGAESIRRPMSTVSNGSNGRGEGGSGSSSPAPVMPGAGGTMMGMNAMVGNGMGGGGGAVRAYHPYGGFGGATHSRGGSTHSSPAVYSVPLGSASAGGDPSLQQQHQQQQDGPQLRRSDSRASFNGEQEQQMYGATTTRTESPGSFMQRSYHHHQQQQHPHHPGQPTESPAHYTMELPPQQQHMYHHANTMPVEGGVAAGGAYGYQQAHATL